MLTIQIKAFEKTEARIRIVTVKTSGAHQQINFFQKKWHGDGSTRPCQLTNLTNFPLAHHANSFEKFNDEHFFLFVEGRESCL